LQEADNVAKPQIWRIKMTTPASVLFWGMDPSYVEFWRDMRSLAFGEVPDYDRMKKRFVDCWMRDGYGESPGEVDWCAVIDQLLEKKLHHN
jgi:casein kinase I family protein HRR25